MSSISSYSWSVRRLVKTVLRKVAKSDYMKGYIKPHHQNYYGTQARRVNCTLRIPEFKKLERAAKRHGKKTSVFLRETALAYINNESLIPEHMEELFRELIIQHRKLGVHLNQIAKKANRFQKLTFPDIAKTVKTVDRWEDRVVGLFKKYFVNGD